jgi:predicted dienelactone hydrolase
MRVIAVAVVLATTAVAHALPTAGRPGHLAVGVRTLDLFDASRGRKLTTEVWYPAKSAGRDTPTQQHHQLVILVHGHCGSRTNYEYLTRTLAARGLIVAAPDVPSFCLSNGPVDLADVPGDITFLRKTLHDRNGIAAGIAQAVRGSRTALVGHSLGGAAVVAAALADSQFRALVLLAPAVGAANATPFTTSAPRRALLVMGGTADTTVPFDVLTLPFFQGLPPPAYLVRITGGTHSGFTDVDSQLTAAALAAQQTVVDSYATAFFDRYLRGRNVGNRLQSSDDGTVMVTAKTK